MIRKRELAQNRSGCLIVKRAGDLAVLLCSRCRVRDVLARNDLVLASVRQPIVRCASRSIFVNLLGIELACRSDVARSDEQEALRPSSTRMPFLISSSFVPTT